MGHMGEQFVGSTAHPKTLFAFGINHKTAPVEIREKLHLRDDEIPLFLELLRKSLTECVVLSTCNRTEVYGVSESVEINIEHFQDLLVRFKDAGDVVRPEHFFALISCAATQQLFNVATSIDSRVRKSLSSSSSVLAFRRKMPEFQKKRPVATYSAASSHMGKYGEPAPTSRPRSSSAMR